MVASNHVLALAAAFAGAVPTVLAGTLVEAVQLPDIIEYTPTVVRRATTVDPYAGYSVRPLYVLKPLPANPSCTQNNCWRYVVTGPSLVATPGVLTLDAVLSSTPEVAQAAL